MMACASTMSAAAAQALQCPECDQLDHAVGLAEPVEPEPTRKMTMVSAWKMLVLCVPN